MKASNRRIASQTLAAVLSFSLLLASPGAPAWAQVMEVRVNPSPAAAMAGPAVAATAGASLNQLALIPAFSNPGFPAAPMSASARTPLNLQGSSAAPWAAARTPSASLRNAPAMLGGNVAPVAEEGFAAWPSSSRLRSEKPVRQHAVAAQHKIPNRLGAARIAVLDALFDNSGARRGLRAAEAGIDDGSHATPPADDSAVSYGEQPQENGAASSEGEEDISAYQKLSPEALALHKEWEETAGKRLADFQLELDKVKSGRFSLAIVSTILQDGRVMFIPELAFSGRLIAQQQLYLMIKVGQISLAEVRNAQRLMKQAAPNLIKKFVALVERNEAEHAAVHRKMARMVQGTYKSVPNPEFVKLQEQQQLMPPPNLKPEQFDGLLKKLVQMEIEKRGPDAPPAPATLLEAEALRLAGVMTTIDRSYVDAIPTETWDKAIAVMSEVAAKAFDAVKSNWSDTITAMLKALTERILDPHSVYWSEKEFKSFQEQLSGTFVGIGAIFKMDALINVVMPNAPAQEAGLVTGDKVVAVDGKAVKTTEEAVTAIRGKEGTIVRLQIERGGQLLPEFSIQRAPIHHANVYSRMAAADVGYIHIGQFEDNAEVEVFAAINQLREKGAKKLVLDVRGNPGGLVTSVASIVASFFKDGQRIASFKQRGLVMNEDIADGDGRFADMPVAVLVDGHSASASEILAGAFQDVRGPVVVGAAPTYGKDSMQTTLPDKAGRALKLTIGRWFTPADRNIDNRRNPETREKIEGTGGIIPDHAVTVTEEQETKIMKQLYDDILGIPVEEPRVVDPALEKAIEVLSAPTPGNA